MGKKSVNRRIPRKQKKHARRHQESTVDASDAKGPETPFSLVETPYGWRKFPTDEAPRDARRVALDEDRIVGPVPGDALRADPSRQEVGYGEYALLYSDVEGTCFDCRQPFVFSAEEQRHWFEVLQIPRQVWPKRCAACRRRERQRKEDWKVLMAAVPAWEADDTPETREAVVRATHAVREHVGGHALKRAIGLGRRLPGLEALVAELEEESSTRICF